MALLPRLFRRVLRPAFVPEILKPILEKIIPRPIFILIEPSIRWLPLNELTLQMRKVISKRLEATRSVCVSSLITVLVLVNGYLLTPLFLRLRCISSFILRKYQPSRRTLQFYSFVSYRRGSLLVLLLLSATS